MISQNKKAKLAITMFRDKVFFIEAEMDQAVSLLSAGEVGLKKLFDFDIFISSQNIPLFAETLNSLIDRFAISAPVAVFVLDKRMVVIRRLKVDRELKGNELTPQIEWELEQFLLSPRNEYHVNYERISSQREQFDYLLLAAVRKSIVRFIIDIFKNTPVELKTLEIDILSTIRGLFTFQCVESVPGLSTIISFQEEYIQLILLKDGVFVINEDIYLEPTTEKSEVKKQRTEEIATLINDQILNMLDSLGDEVLLKNIENIYLFNGKAHVDVVSSLQILQRAARIHFVEPLKNIKHSLSMEEESVIAANPISFLALLGALWQ